MDLLQVPAGVGPACRPNISAAGKRRRVQIGAVGVLVTVVALGVAVLSGASWAARLLVGLPAASAAVTLLQVRRDTCIARAAEGTFEHDDFSRTAMAAADVAASQRVARGIVRDAVLIGLGVAGLSAATALL